ncbi:hypothetical protein JCM11641_000209 [Rhodosporidiobolus odoratus]
MAQTGSDSFQVAVEWVKASSASTSNETKLRLYALYKIATESTAPVSSRPGIFDFTGRAKWDAWAALGKQFEQEEDGGKARAQREYQDEAHKLGWRDEESTEAVGGKEEEPAREEKQEKMVSVSVLESGFVDEAPPSKLHELAISGDAASLSAFLATQGKTADLNEKDSYGYAPLHLAVDRGNLVAARLLLEAGADKSLPDEDGNTPLDLARIAEQDELVTLLSST